MDENKLIQLFKDMLKEELSPIKEDIKGMKEDVTSLKEGQNSLEKDVKTLQIQVKENTELIKALIHNSEVHKAEQDKTNNDTSHMQGDITSIKNTVNDIKSTVEDIKKDLNNVEIITSSNWNDIAKLKAVK